MSDQDQRPTGWIENPIPWPGGARCAAAFTFDVDVDSMMRLTYGGQAPARAATMSWLGYESVAVPRLVRFYRERGIKQTFFFPGYCIDTYPELVDAVAEDGNEVGLHGYLHEVSWEQVPEGELEILERGLEAAERVLGGAPTGWRAPLYALSDRSPQMLLEHGFVYDASLMGDDQPYLLRTPAGDLIELPSEWANDDWTHYAHVPDLEYTMQVRAPQRAEEVYMAEFEAAYRHGGMWIGVFHPSISARLARLEVLERMIETMQSRGDVWIATLGEIAGHVQSLLGTDGWSPQVVEVERTVESGGAEDE
ncbi:MAG: polysaccharide deacetylase [Solirubrobacterales bacterium]